MPRRSPRLLADRRPEGGPARTWTGRELRGVARLGRRRAGRLRGHRRDLGADRATALCERDGAEVGARREGRRDARSWPRGRSLGGVAFDTMLAALPARPGGRRASTLQPLCEHYLGTDVLGAPSTRGGRGPAVRRSRGAAAAAEAAAVALLAPVMAERIERAGLARAARRRRAAARPRCSRGCRRAALRSTSTTWRRWPRASATGWRRCRPRSTGTPGEEFNLNSPPQLREILYEKLGLSPGKKTPKGQLSTDASVLEKLRDAASDRRRAAVVARARQAELDVPRGAAAAGRPARRAGAHDVQPDRRRDRAASSSNPNLQNIPVRAELGRQIRRAFVPGAPRTGAAGGRLLADRAADPGAPVRRRGPDGRVRVGDATSTRPRRRGSSACREDQVDPATRSRAKTINYGLAYGMNAWGLAYAAGDRRRRGAGDHRRVLRELPADPGLPRPQVARAAAEGFTETMLGRRRYIPELQAANPRVRDLGRRHGAERADPGQRGRRVQARR